MELLAGLGILKNFVLTDGVYGALTEETQVWNDEHSMVSVNFAELQVLLQPYFEVHVLEHDYEKIVPWDQRSGNALFACVKL